MGSRLQEIAEDAEHIFYLYPKIRCEVNWLEYTGAAAALQLFTYRYRDSRLADGVNDGL